MTSETEILGRSLAKHCREGQLAEAYRILQDSRYESLPAIALLAGFHCIDPKKRRSFMSHLVAQIVKACGEKTDGYGLRNNQ